MIIFLFFYFLGLHFYIILEVYVSFSSIIKSIVIQLVNTS